MSRPPTDPACTGIVHVHSSYSHDGRDSLAHLRSFALHRGIGFICMTDHAEDFDRRRFDEFTADCERHSDERLRIIPGLEFRFRGYKGLHLLALGLREWIEPETPDAFAAVASHAAGFTIMAHPRLAGYVLPESLQRTIGGIEVWNPVYDTRYLPDGGAVRLMRWIRRSRSEVVGLAGLDQHDARNDRETRVILTGSRLDPLEALRTGRFLNLGRTMRFGSTVELSRLGSAALAAGSAGLGLINRAHERLMLPRNRVR